jgi:phage terminase Nu1 subunit (DNA packaging protein)
LLEIDLRERKGELLVAADVESRLVNVFAQCKTKLLGVPSRVRQRDPSLTRAQIALIDNEIRDCLEALADGSTADADQASA